MKKVNESPKGSPKTRLRAGERRGVGDARYELIRSAAQRAHQAMDAGYYLEATTLVESLLAERLEKRAQWLWHHPPEPGRQKYLDKVKDGFRTLGLLTAALLKVETDPDLIADMNAIAEWGQRRNDVIHEMAKYGLGAEQRWRVRYEEAGRVARSGVVLVLSLDAHERRSSHRNRQKLFSSATCPDALATLGQRVCEWCEAALEHSTLRRPVGRA